jgi:hypothetical protein
LQRAGHFLGKDRLARVVVIVIIIVVIHVSGFYRCGRHDICRLSLSLEGVDT